MVTKTNKNSPVKRKVSPKREKNKKNTSAKARTDKSNFSNFEPYKLKKGEKYLNDSQEKHLKKILVDWRSTLMEEVDKTVNYLQDEASNFPDPADRAAQEEEFSIELRTRDRERKLIRKIDDTLERLEQGEYGYCDSCGIEIGLRRLEARPTAEKCVDCKSLDEIREKQLRN
jgi:DnaK suppressor protein